MMPVVTGSLRGVMLADAAFLWRCARALTLSGAGGFRSVDLSSRCRFSLFQPASLFLCFVFCFFPCWSRFRVLYYGPSTQTPFFLHTYIYLHKRTYSFHALALTLSPHAYTPHTMPIHPFLSPPHPPRRPYAVVENAEPRCRAAKSRVAGMCRTPSLACLLALKDALDLSGGKGDGKYLMHLT